MTLQRLVLASSLLAAAASAANAAPKAGGPTTVLGFPEQTPHQDLQILGQSGDSVTYKVVLDERETWTVTYAPQKIVGHGELEISQGAKDIVDRTCDVVKGSVLAACAQSVSGTGLTPEDEKEMAEANKLGSQPLPTDGPDAVLLMPLAVGPDAGSAAPGAAPLGPAGPEATGRPPTSSSSGPSAGGLAGGPAGGSGSGSGSGMGPSAEGGEKKKAKPDAGSDTSPAAGGATGSPSTGGSATTSKAAKPSGGAPPPVAQTGSGAVRNGAMASVPLFMLGLAAIFVL